VVNQGRIESVDLTSDCAALPDLGRGRLHCAFAMPGLVEAHAHLFLDGAELDADRRAAYQNASFETMLEVARRNLRDSLDCGITLVRDAGDRFGVNHAMRAESRSPRVRSPGLALNRPGRYGAFMAQGAANDQEIDDFIARATGHCDDLKIILTGIINFERGTVPGRPQFELPELHRIVAAASRVGLPSFAHCSGIEGLNVAAAAGVNSIEHGFFMEERILDMMAARDIAWVPTFAPLDFQLREPRHAGWNESTQQKLRGILDQHASQVALAVHKGVPVIPGSDAGTVGVPHGRSLIDELLRLHGAGMPMGLLLANATNVPRARWRARCADIAIGNHADLVGYAASPFQCPTALRQPRFVLLDDDLHRCAGADPMAGQAATNLSGVVGLRA
jgi:imidazolonepropionase-like amidohydrolase